MSRALRCTRGLCLLLVLLTFLSSESIAQCGYSGINWGDVTPAGVGNTVTLTNVWGGDQYSLQATTGCTYTVSTCGGGWDSQITVFDPALTAVAYNDDFCGLQSQVTFTALTTGTFTIQVNEYFCGSNFTSLPSFTVTLDSCTAMDGCNDPAACNYNAADSNANACCYDNCSTIDLADSWGDGWNGATYTITDDANNVLGTGTMAAGTNQTDQLCLPEGCFTITVGGGTFDGEISWTFNDSTNGSTSGAAGTYTITVGNVVAGCTDSNAANYDPAAQCDDGSCVDCYSSDPTGCPEIDLGADIAIPECSDPCENLTLTADYFETGETTDYEACGIAYNPPYPYNTGTQFSINTDDVWSDVISLPFDFCFYGTNYSQIIVGSNGVISFNLADAAGYCGWAFNESCPDPNLPMNSIFGIYHDIDPSVCGAARYAVLGTAPCRVFVVNYDGVCHFSCNAMTSTSQIVLYETTNVIEVYVEQKETCTGWNSGNALIGVQNATGTAGVTPDSRQTGPWTAGNEAWRFTPSGNSIVDVNWYSQDDGFIGSGASIEICPDQDTEAFVAEAVYTLCDGSTITVADNVIVTCAQILLPVEWLDFQAKLINQDQEVLCQWQTATEVNNEYFTVERSADGETWEDIGNVLGAGTITEPQSYQFIDRDPLFGVSYYRIRQTDYNGEFDHSVIRSVERLHSGFSVYPNPGNGVFRLQGAQKGNIKIYNTRGRQVQVHWMSRNELQLDVASGVYFFVLELGKGVEPLRQRVIVQR